MWLAEKWPEMVKKCAELLTIVATRLGETVFTKCPIDGEDFFVAF